MHDGAFPAVHDAAPRPPEPDAVHVVARTPALAEVRIADSGQLVTIGTVRLAHDSWCWVHNDGEQSSPLASTRLVAAKALADYHRAYKPRRARASMRQLLDNARAR